LLTAKNLADLPFLQIRQIRAKAEIETRIEHAVRASGGQRLTRGELEAGVQ
jgi:hypothetical protein